MKRKVKNMYTEIILDTIINGQWDFSSKKEIGIFGDWYVYYFASRVKSVGKFSYRFKHEYGGVFSKKVTVYVGSGYNIDQTDNITYSIFSPIYWRLRQMFVDHKNSEKISETNLYMDTYKEFKETVVKRDIASIEQSLANLSKAEAEQRKMLEELKKGETV